MASQETLIVTRSLENPREGARCDWPMHLQKCPVCGEARSTSANVVPPNGPLKGVLVAEVPPTASEAGAAGVGRSVRDIVEERDRALEEVQELRRRNDHLHQLVCDARSYIDPEKQPQWEEIALVEAGGCEDALDALRGEVQTLRGRVAHLESYAEAKNQNERVNRRSLDAVERLRVELLDYIDGPKPGVDYKALGAQWEAEWQMLHWIANEPPYLSLDDEEEKTDGQ